MHAALFSPAKLKLYLSSLTSPLSFISSYPARHNLIWPLLGCKHRRNISRISASKPSAEPTHRLWMAPGWGGCSWSSRGAGSSAGSPGQHSHNCWCEVMVTDSFIFKLFISWCSACQVSQEHDNSCQWNKSTQWQAFNWIPSPSTPSINTTLKQLHSFIQKKKKSKKQKTNRPMRSWQNTYLFWILKCTWFCFLRAIRITCLGSLSAALFVAGERAKRGSSCQGVGVTRLPWMIHNSDCFLIKSPS